MKTLLILSLLFTADVTSAVEVQDRYCTDQSKKAHIVEEDSVSNIDRQKVSRGEIVATLHDGRVVIVPCHGRVKLSKDTWRVDSYIIQGNRVYLPVDANFVGDFRVVGVNLNTSKYLVERDFFLKRYYIVHSDILENQKNIDLQRRIDKR